MSIWDERILRNPISSWAALALVTLAIIAVGWAFGRMVEARRGMKRTRSAAQVGLAMLAATSWPTWLGLTAYAAQALLAYPPRVGDYLGRAILLSAALQLGMWVSAAITHAVELQRQLDTRTSAATMVSALALVSRIAIWSLLFVAVLSNFGVEVTTLIAGLGVGGIAAALAVQNVLGDLFASLSIYFDRPFDLDDWIQVDALEGVVTEITWRTTRLRALDGEQIVLANSDLGKARIRNFRRLVERRVMLRFPVAYETPSEVLRGLGATIKSLVSELPNVRVDRVHLRHLEEGALIYEIVFWVTSNDFVMALDRRESAIITVKAELDRLGVSLGHPTRTLRVAPRPDAAKDDAKDAKDATNGATKGATVVDDAEGDETLDDGDDRPKPAAGSLV